MLTWLEDGLVDELDAELDVPQDVVDVEDADVEDALVDDVEADDVDVEEQLVDDAEVLEDDVEWKTSMWETCWLVVPFQRPEL